MRRMATLRSTSSGSGDTILISAAHGARFLTSRDLAQPKSSSSVASNAVCASGQPVSSWAPTSRRQESGTVSPEPPSFEQNKVGSRKTCSSRAAQNNRIDPDDSRHGRQGDSRCYEHLRPLREELSAPCRPDEVGNCSGPQGASR